MSELERYLAALEFWRRGGLLIDFEQSKASQKDRLLVLLRHR